MVLYYNINEYNLVNNEFYFDWIYSKKHHQLYLGKSMGKSSRQSNNKDGTT